MKKQTNNKVDHRGIIAAFVTRAFAALDEWSASRENSAEDSPRQMTMPHYVFSPDGLLVDAIYHAANEGLVSEDFLRKTLDAIGKKIKKAAPTMRIAEAVKILNGLEPLGGAIKEAFEQISLELSRLEKLPPGTRSRKGASTFAGKSFNNVKVAKDSSFIMVGSVKYNISGVDTWVIIDRVLKAISESERGYVIDITTADVNKLKNRAKDFFNKFCKRKQIPKKQQRGNNKFYPKAKVLIDNIITAR